MKETTEIKDIETVETVETVEQEPVKPYTFRKLSAEDMFLMFTIIKKIGLKEFKQCLEGDSLDTLVALFRSGGADKEGNAGGADKALTAIGVTVGFEALDIILGNLPKCEKEIYKLLAQVSDLSEDAIKADMILFTEMVIDFFKKEEFPAFIKVVSKLFK